MKELETMIAGLPKLVAAMTLDEEDHRLALGKVLREAKERGVPSDTCEELRMTGERLFRGVNVFAQVIRTLAKGQLALAKILLERSR